MPRDQLQRLRQQHAARRPAVPGRHPARMRQADHVGRHPVPVHPLHHPDHLAQRPLVPEHLLDRQPADRQDQLRPDDLQLRRQEALTAGDLLAVRLAVAAAGRLAGEAARHRRHVHALAQRLLIRTRRRREPAKQGLARRPRERPTQRPLAGPRRLPDQQQLAQHRRPVHRRTLHRRTGPTGPQLLMKDLQALDGHAFAPVRASVARTRPPRQTRCQTRCQTRRQTRRQTHAIVSRSAI